MCPERKVLAKTPALRQAEFHLEDKTDTHIPKITGNGTALLCPEWVSCAPIIAMCNTLGTVP